jgi:hypothetical protein
MWSASASCQGRSRAMPSASARGRCSPRGAKLSTTSPVTFAAYFAARRLTSAGRVRRHGCMRSQIAGARACQLKCPVALRRHRNPHRMARHRARSSAGERSLHTREVAGSKPAAPIGFQRITSVGCASFVPIACLLTAAGSSSLDADRPPVSAVDSAAAAGSVDPSTSA